MNLRTFIILTKVLPISIAFIHLINIILSYFYCSDIPLNYIGGISLLPILYLYVASYVFKLCNYYRMFLHYSVIVDLINVYDYYVGLPLDDLNLFMILMTISIITMLIVIYLKFFV